MALLPAHSACACQGPSQRAAAPTCDQQVVHGMHAVLHGVHHQVQRLAGHELQAALRGHQVRLVAIRGLGDLQQAAWRSGMVSWCYHRKDTYGPLGKISAVMM
jgi:hypothetical protein